MTRITQRFAATALAAALLGAAAVPSMAQTAPAPAAATAERPQHPRAMTPEQRQQRMAQHAQALKAKLKITPAQEPAWNTFQQAMRPGERHARIDREGLGQLSTPERIDRMRALRAQRLAEADKRGDAVKAFYAALTPEQQKVFDAESARMHGQHGPKGGHGPHGRPAPAAS